MIFAVLDVSLAVNLCINCSFLHLSRVKVSGTNAQPFQRYWGFGVFGGFGVFWGVWGFLGVWGFWVFGVLGCFGVLGF